MTPNLDTADSPLGQLAKHRLGEIAFATQVCYEMAYKAGWWTELTTGLPLARNKGELIALIHSELSEALEGARRGSMDEHLPHRKSEEVELADTVIRIFDYCGGFGLDLAGAIIEKLEYNAQRADHRAASRQAEGGKKF